MKYPKVNIVKEEDIENIPLLRIVKPKSAGLQVRSGCGNLNGLGYYLNPSLDHRVVEDNLGELVLISTYKQDL